MRSESDTPIEERFLCLEGFVSAKAMAQVSAGLPATKPENAEAFFVQFSYADLPIGKEFQVAFLKNKPEVFVNCLSKVTAVTQQFGKPFTEVPHGWKTICYIQLPTELPELLKQLPTIDAWHQNTETVYLSSLETWQAIAAKGVR
jgi:hypothetical protein